MIISQRKKCPFTLVEVVLSFILIAMAATAIYSIYIAVATGTASAEKKIHAQREVLSNSRKIRHYLMSIITPYNTLIGKGAARPFFLTEGTNGTRGFQVYACLNNGTDPLPALSNEVLGRFYIDHEGTFKLTLASHPIRSTIFHPCEADITLWKGVESVLWEFSTWPDANSKKNSKVGTIAQDSIPKGQWVREWKREWMYEPPTLIRLTVVIKNPKSLHRNGEVCITAIHPTAIQTLEFQEGG